ncbi:MAG: nucleoside-diphosphate kinase [Patescibacteria group bacterium]
MKLKEEQTFVLIKPDAVQKGLIGEIVRRFEQRDLKIVALEMFQPTTDQIDEHYPKDKTWVTRLGKKSLSTYKKYDIDPVPLMGTNDPAKMGPMVRQWIVDYMISAPLVRVIVQGLHAVDTVRKIAGNTLPFLAEIGTIRGDFSIDSPALANSEKRAVMNLVHASETQQEAAHEIKHWFSNVKPLDYKRFGVDA